ncbi:unnamed protein product [Dibothriocephalus latus]|uniref:Uncharacterized protein n=1 Tax=Dibothriocephalus latus TaxID=60516 RepID=A0A3P6QCE1_DIBLA|nr:unnamed protein product [Dibothriocephalus latus]
MNTQQSLTIVTFCLEARFQVPPAAGSRLGVWTNELIIFMLMIIKERIGLQKESCSRTEILGRLKYLSIKLHGNQFYNLIDPTGINISTREDFPAKEDSGGLANVLERCVDMMKKKRASPDQKLRWSSFNMNLKKIADAVRGIWDLEEGEVALLENILNHAYLLEFISSGECRGAELDAFIVKSLTKSENYKMIRQISGKGSTLCGCVLDVNDGFIAENSAKADHWREHYVHLLNFDEQPMIPSFSSAAEFHPSPAYAVSYNLPSQNEVAPATQRPCNSKASGEDGIPTEICESCPDILVSWLHEVIKQARRDEVVPNDSELFEGVNANEIWKFRLRMALQLNRTDFLSENMFAGVDWRMVPDKFVEISLLEDKRDFLQLLLDAGFPLHRYITLELIEKLYQADFENNVCFASKCFAL